MDSNEFGGSSEFHTQALGVALEILQDAVSRGYSVACTRHANYSRISDSLRARATSDKAAINDSVLYFELHHYNVPYPMAGAVLSLSGARGAISGFVIIDYAASDSRSISTNSAGAMESRWPNGHDRIAGCRSHTAVADIVCNVYKVAFRGSICWPT